MPQQGPEQFGGALGEREERLADALANHQPVPEEELAAFIEAVQVPTGGRLRGPAMAETTPLTAEQRAALDEMVQEGVDAMRSETGTVDPELKALLEEAYAAETDPDAVQYHDENQ